MMRVVTGGLSVLALIYVGTLPVHAQNMAGGVVPVAAPDLAKVNDYKKLRQLDQRLATIGYRLQKTATPWCATTEYQMGWVLTDRTQYPADDQAAAAYAYGTSWPGAGDIIIAAVAKDSPASRASFHIGEGVLAIDDVDPASLTRDGIVAKKHKKADSKDNSFDRMGRIEAAMADRFADGEAQVRIQSPVRAGQGMSVAATMSVPLERVCASIISLHVGSDMGAGADGHRVRINHRLALYTKDDSELAWVVAHELAHNILGHRQRLDKAKVNRGLFQQFGKNAKLTRQTEDEADRLSMWLVVKAGYDPAAAQRFWQRYGPEYDSPLIRSGTHSNWKERMTALQVETDVAVAAFKENPDARPPVLPTRKGTR